MTAEVGQTRRRSGASPCRSSETRCPAAFACKRERGVLRFNADGPEGLKNRWGAGPKPKLTAEYRQALAEMVERGPIPAIHGVVRWRRCDLAQELYETFGVSVEETTIGRALREMGYRKLSARPRHHAQNEYAVEDFKKLSPPNWRRSRRASTPA